MIMGGIAFGIECTFDWNEPKIDKGINAMPKVSWKEMHE